MESSARQTPPETPDNANANQTFSIGELSREFNITLRSIRFYEDQGLLTPTRVGTTRIFSRRDRGRLAMICRGKRLGFSLKVIKTFLDLYQHDGCNAEQMRYLLDKAKERIKVLEQQRVDLELTLKELHEIETDMSTQLKAVPVKSGG